MPSAIQFRQAEHAKSLLRRGVSEKEIYFLTGLSSSEMYCDKSEPKDGEYPSKYDNGGKHRKAIDDISDGIRQLYELGYDVQDICDRLARLIDVIGQDIIKAKMMLKGEYQA